MLQGHFYSRGFRRRDGWTHAETRAVIGAIGAIRLCCT